MSDLMKKEPKVFISYSHTSELHKGWVLEQAESLVDHGIEVILDAWDLNPGQDAYAFMESSVNDPTIDKVLIIAEKGYYDRAMARRGGVGAETQILSPEIYSQAASTKFIPIVAERDEEGEAYIPTFIRGRIYIDLSNPSTYFDEFVKLVRDIYNKPKHKKPALGARPTFLEDDEKPHNLSKLVNKEREIERAVTNNHLTRLNNLANSYKDEFMNMLPNFIVQYNEINEATEKTVPIMKKIESIKELFDSFHRVSSKLFEGGYNEPDFYIQFLEDITEFHDFNRDFYDTATNYEYQYDHFKFLTWEMFLCITNKAIKLKEHQLLKSLINEEYEIISWTGASRNSTFTYFCKHLLVFDLMNESQGLRRISLQSDTLKKRHTTKYFSELVDTDIILYNISEIKYRDDHFLLWYPFTSIYYPQDTNHNIKFLSRLKFVQHYEQIISLFDVESKEELIEAIKNIELKRVQFFTIPTIQHFIKNLEEMRSK